jgi:diguanylate cyclase (GGDEF)-like protein/PAS domain S-box-containing protein
MNQNPIPLAALRWRQSASVIAVAVICIVASLFAWYSLYAAEKRAIDLEFSGRANNQQIILQSGIDDYWDSIYAVRALFDSSNNPVAREEFERFANSLLAGHSAILNVAWISRVRREERIAHELAGARDGLPNYHIRSVAPDRSLPIAPERDEYFPKFYSTEDRGSPVYGLDLNDDGPRMQTLARIRDNDTLSISPPLTLHISQEDRLGFWAGLPIYAQGVPHNSVEDRRKNLRGIVQGVFQIRAMIDKIFSEVRTPVRLYLFGQGAGATDLPIYFTSRLDVGPIEARPLAELTAGTHRAFPIKFGDVQWTMVVTPEPEALTSAAYRFSSIVLITGLVLGGILTLFIWALQRANTTLRHRDASLAFANTLMLAATEGALDAILVVDEGAKIVSYNQKFIDLWNIPQAMVDARIDGPILAAVASQIRDTASFVARVRYLYSHPTESSRDRLELTDGRIVDRYTTALYSDENTYLGRIWFFRDVTDRERARAVLAKNEEKYRNLVESTTDVIWEIDRKGRYTYISPTVKALIGYEPQELIGKTPFDLMPPAEAQRVAKIFESLVATYKPFSAVENTNLRKDGTEVVLETSGVPIFDDGGVWQGYRGIDRDITERKLAAEKLQQRDALLHAVAVSATEFLTAPVLDEAMQRALELISKTIRAERVTVLESGATRLAAPILRYIWQAPDIEVPIDARLFENPRLVTPEIAGWLAAGSEGKIVLSNLRTASSGVKSLLAGIGIKTLLFVPIMIDGKHWGQIGIDSCKVERSWEDFEIEILRTLAELIGNAIQRERYVREIANANRIVQNTPTILYRLRGEPALPMIYISQNVKLFGHEPAALVVSPNLYLSLIHPDDVARVRGTMAATLEKGEPRGMNEFRLLTSQGEYRWVENRYTLIRDTASRLVEIEGLLFDVTERKAAEEKIAKLARTDALTGLPNRSTFIERLQQTFAAARRGASSFAVFYLDIDHFKDINDTLGHPVGDSVLIKVGECIKNSVRETDLVARFGGDEFAILQADLVDSSDAGSLAVKIRTELAVPILLGGNVIHMTASIGIATYAPEVAKPEDMLAQADVALYRAKEEGRDQYRFHSEALDIEVRERVALAEELRLAIDREELELYYQPQVELSTGQIVGMEALIRWNHPTRGLLLPSAFIAVAEKTGSIAAIGRWVLDRACRQMNLWRKDGIAPPTLAVNISLTQVSAANEFIQLVTETLSKWSLAATDLEFDVTESMLARATLAQNDVLERLHKLGVKIAIDDFGTKFSTLDYLKIYRVNRLKIPHALIAAAAKDPESAAIVRAIAGIARELNIDVVAQGVETEAQWSYLTATSAATKVQGFFYSEPVPADRAKDLLEVGHINAPEKHRELTPAKHH